ncbi:MAG TPA: FtsX-like permease family protein [Kofleriaceae bacterium]|nr:FtsX-like permease family protein [Kofleriaceae bacterium]
MIRHLFRLVWNRKRANALVVLEILLCFIVVFGVLVFGVAMADNLRRPLGYTTTDVWSVSFGRELDAVGDPKAGEVIDRLLQVARGLAPVEAVAANLITPYSTNEAVTNAAVNGRTISFAFSTATDDIAAVLRLNLVAGRWFGRQDDHARDTPTIVTSDLARELFGEADPIGREIPSAAPPPGAEPSPARRIIGVLSAYRAGGELAGGALFALYRADPGNPRISVPRSLLLRVRPGTPRAFEEQLVKTLQAAVPDYQFAVEPLSEIKAKYRDRYVLPLGIAAVVAGFLIVMVALGLTGVLWQNVTKRTKEIGLRRATGATARQISLQILGETWILTTLALAAGAVLVLQLPLLELLPFVTAPVFAVSFALSLVTLYALATLCAFYPSWLATRISPTEALRHE